MGASTQVTGNLTYQDLVGAAEERRTGMRDFHGRKLGHVFTATSSSAYGSSKSGSFGVGVLFLHEGARLAIEFVVGAFTVLGTSNRQACGDSQRRSRVPD